MDGWIGEVKYFAGTYPPQNWAFCEGQRMPIQQYTALYSIIGCQFGGDGKTYFNLPDFRGRMCLGTGQSEGTSYRHQGEIGGYEKITLTSLSMAAHNHEVKCQPSTPLPQQKNTPENNLYSTRSVGTNFAPGTGTTTQMKQDMIDPVGQNAPHENMPPWLCLRIIICLNGLYPVRP
jgi:microcystin-dependent protein